jgi:hypothetical protein
MPYSGMTLHRVISIVGVGMLTVALSSCDLAVGPDPQGPRDLALDFCSDDTPVWFAYQNLGSSQWVHVTPDPAGTFRFTAEYYVTLVYVRQSGSDYHTEIIGATNLELSQVSASNCLEESGSKQLNGSVTGISGSQKAQVSMMFASPYLQSPQTSFTLQNLPDRSLDLVASRVIITGTTQSSDRIIIRRNQNLVNGATLTVLDFESAEAFTATTNTVRARGLISTETSGLGNNFFSSQGTPHVLYFSELSGDADLTVPSVPFAQTIAGEYNDMFMFSNNADGRFRGIETFFRNPADKTLTMGGYSTPTPTFTTVSTVPYPRLRMRLGFGTVEYLNAVNFLLHQQFQQISVTDVSLTVTGAYYTSSSTEWDLTLPDFSGVEGWQNAWGLQDGTPFTWRTTVYRGRAELLFGAAPDENEAILFAGRASSPPPPALRALVAPTASVTAPRRRLSSPRP